MEAEGRYCPECGEKAGPSRLHCTKCGKGLNAGIGPFAGSDGSPGVPGEIRTRVHQLLATQQYIGAIKLYREHTALSLKESRDAVDAYAAENGIDTGARRSSPWNCVASVLGFLLWVALMGAMPFVAQRFAPMVFGPDISKTSVETCMVLLPIFMILASLAVFLFFLMRSSRRKSAGAKGGHS